MLPTQAFAWQQSLSMTHAPPVNTQPPLLLAHPPPEEEEALLLEHWPNVSTTVMVTVAGAPGQLPLASESTLLLQHWKDAPGMVYSRWQLEPSSRFKVTVSPGPRMKSDQSLAP
jgi:hypothetical protein